MTLPQTWRLKAHLNYSSGDPEFNTDSANNVLSVVGIGSKYADGVADWDDATDTVFEATADATAGSTIDGDPNDNDTDAFEQMECHAYFKTNATTTVSATAASIDFYLEYSPDGGTTWPSDSADFALADLDLVGSIIVAAASGYERSSQFILR